MKPVLLKRISIACILAVLGFALLPNQSGPRFAFMPVPFRIWVNANDDLENIVAFFVLALATLRLPGPRAKRVASMRSAIVRSLATPIARAGGLMLLVCAIEFTQWFIPGRVSDLQDVCTGWSGIFAAWLVSSLLDSREGDSGGEK